MGIGRFLDRVIVDLYGLVSFELIFMEKLTIWMISLD